MIPHEFKDSQALQYAISKGWSFKQTDSQQFELEICPYCKKSGYGHFYVQAARGLFLCHRCGKSGNLHKLKEDQGDVIRGVSTATDWSRSGGDVEQLPNTDALHEALLADEDALDYLINGRGFSREIIKQQKLGLTVRYFRGVGEVRALVYPYLFNGNTVFVHYRTLPIMNLKEGQAQVPKEFNSPKGWDAPLYNAGVIQDGLKELVMVEGEANVIAAMDKGVTNVVGVPGANFKKALWIDELDRIAPERIYICYDKDKVGQRAAQTLASRIGIERCWKITLPDFTVTVDGVERPGKDLNEYFTHGGTAESFQQLLAEAELFDVQGVSSTDSMLDELEDHVKGKVSLEPTYKTPWEPLNGLVGFEDGDVIDLIGPAKFGKTTVGMNMMEFAVNQYGEDGVIICLEMTTQRLGRKWVCHVTQTEDFVPKTPEEGKFLRDKILTAISDSRTLAANRPGTLYFCYPQYSTTDEIYKLIRDCIRRYGVKWVMLDNIQRLCDTTLKGQNRTVHLTQISKVLSQIAKDYGIKLIRIIQPHRVADGKIVQVDDVDGSSQMDKDCDCMMTMHRNALNAEMTQKDFADIGYFEQEGSFDTRTLFSVGLSRYSSGGKVTLEFDGATSTLREYDAVRAAKKDVPLSYAENNQSAGITALKEAVPEAITA